MFVGLIQTDTIAHVASASDTDWSCTCGVGYAADDPKAVAQAHLDGIADALEDARSHS